jgi:segregation and condensation protein B
MSLKAKLEAVIYAAEEPVTLAQLTALFATDALELKAEREAASAAQASEASDQAIAEASPLLVEASQYLDLDQSLPEEPVVSAPTEAVAAEAEPDSAPADVEAAQDQASPEDTQPAPESAPAAIELEAKRLARLRDREVRAIIRAVLGELIDDYASDARGVEIREIAGGFRMATKPECHDAVRCFVKSLKPALKLSLPALETLAVIAYKQPVTAPEVNEIRGVDSSGVFGSLLARKLIATAGRKPVIGRPILYKTTREFLLRFGLKDVSELPSMEEFEKLASLELDEPEPAPGAVSPAATTIDLDFEADETAADEPVGQALGPDTGIDESSRDSRAAELLVRAVGQGFIPGIGADESNPALQVAEELDSNSRMYQGTTLVVPQMPQNERRASAPEVSSSNNPVEIHLAPEVPQTAETAGSTEPLSTGEAAPAAPPATEQAETENSPHGEEVHEEN